MKPTRTSGLRLSEFLLATLVLGFLLLYSYARFYMVAYIGFQYNGSDAEVAEVYVSPPGEASLQSGDTILEVNHEGWEKFHNDFRSNPLAEMQTGDEFTLLVQGPQGTRTVEWVVPGFNSQEFISRLVNLWVLSYVFWLAGTATLLLLRPKDERWALLVAFNYVTAIWFMAGTISSTGILASPLVLRAGIWMSLPIYLHLHWNFPRPLRSSSKRFWTSFYLLSAVLAAAQIIGWLPREAHLVAFLFAVIGSVGLLAYRFASRSTERREIGLLFFAAAVALAPALVIAVASLQDISATLPGYLLSLLALPGAYFYVVYRRQLGGLEFRANRLISLYLFLILLVTFALIIFPIIFTFFSDLRNAGGAIILTAIITSLVSIFGFSRFEGFVERRLLRIPQPPQYLLEGFAGRVSTSFSHENLADILIKEVLPSLLIRQSALLDFGSGDTTHQVVYLQSIKQSDLPKLADQKLLTNPGRPMGSASPEGGRLDWLRLVLPLTVGGESRGLWLLGRKDPDDYYSQGEQILLASLADQMAIALVNITQAQHLRALHQADIERQELERVHLARELHDDILNRINDLGNLVDDEMYAKGFGDHLKGVVGQVRNLINGLRPPMLDQGLYFALQELADELAAKPNAKTQVKLSLPHTDARFDPLVEQHLYRIVQQACENTLEHGKAKHLVIDGRIDSSGADLLVEDDGQGFKLGSQPGLVDFLSTRHFGLAGMNERATMIGAKLFVDSSLGKGTRVRLTWRLDDAKK